MQQTLQSSVTTLPTPIFLNILQGMRAVVMSHAFDIFRVWLWFRTASMAIAKTKAQQNDFNS